MKDHNINKTNLHEKLYCKFPKSQLYKIKNEDLLHTEWQLSLKVDDALHYFQEQSKAELIFIHTMYPVHL